MHAGIPPPSRHPSGAGTPPQQTATVADDTHATGMHSCFLFWFLCEYGLPKYGLNSNDGITVCQGVLARRVGTLFVDNDYVVCQVDAGPQQVIQAVNIAVCLTNLSIYFKIPIIADTWRIFQIKFLKKFHIRTSQLNQSSSKPLGRNILFPRSSVQA